MGITWKPTPYWYEVYDKRVLYEDRAGLVLLDRTTRLKRARKMANAWDGVVVRLTLQEDDVIALQVVYVHPSPPPSDRRPQRNVVTLGELRQRLYQGEERPRTKFRKGF